MYNISYQGHPITYDNATWHEIDGSMNSSMDTQNLNERENFLQVIIKLDDWNKPANLLTYLLIN